MPLTLPDDSRISTIGVVGAGTMGSGIAQVAAQSGYDVVLVDQAESWLDRGLQAIADGLDRLIVKGSRARPGLRTSRIATW
jgi:3-hydroxybutyryl-CoA dehydrogenase